MNSNKFYPYETAKFKPRRLKLSSYSKWNNYCKSEKFDKNFPKSPDTHYRDKWWKDWFEFLGNNKDKRKYKVKDKVVIFILITTIEYLIMSGLIKKFFKST